MFSKLFQRKTPTAPVGLDLGNGFTADSRDEFSYRLAEFKIPLGGYYAFTYNGKVVFTIDQYGGHSH